MAFRLFFLGIFWLLLNAAALAQPVGLDTTYVLPEVTVTATRMPVLAERAPVRITVLDSQAIEASGADDVADLLATNSGSFIKQYGSTSLASLSLRGTSASQSLILIDGHRIEHPGLGQLDLSLLPSLLLQSVEIMHGAGSALYGSDSFGGVINLQTLQAPQKELQAKAQVGYGAFNERLGNLVLSGRQGKVSGVGAVEYRTVQGDYSYLNRTLFPPQKVRRKNADRQELSVYSSLGYKGQVHSFQLSGWYTEAERGLPGVSSAAPKGERQWDKQMRFWADYTLDRRWGDLRVGSLVQYLALRYLNPELELNQRGDTWLQSSEVELQMPIGSRWQVSTGLTGSYARVGHPSVAENALEYHLGGFLHGMAEYGRLFIYPGVRFDTYLPPNAEGITAASPRLGLNMQPLKDTPVRVKASIGRSFSVPTLYDRYWQPGGNSELKPERGWTVDTGFMLPFAAQRVEVTAFVTGIRDQIAWYPTSDGYWAPENLGKVRSRGVEVSYRLATFVTDNVRIAPDLLYTWTHARDRSDPAENQRLRYVPAHQLKAAFNGSWQKLQANVSARYTGRRHITQDGRQSMPPHVVLDGQLGVGHRFFWGDARLTLRMENILDQQYAVVRYFPMPPRHLKVRLQVSLD